MLTLHISLEGTQLLHHDLAQRRPRQRLERHDRIDTPQELRWELATIGALDRLFDDLLVLTHAGLTTVIISVVLTDGAVDLRTSVGGQHNVGVQERHLTPVLIRESTVIEHLKQQAHDKWGCLLDLIKQKHAVAGCPHLTRELFTEQINAVITAPFRHVETDEVTLIITKQDLCKLLGDLSVVRDDEITGLIQVFIIVDVDAGHALFRVELFDRADADVIKHLLQRSTMPILTLNGETLLSIKTEKTRFVRNTSHHTNFIFSRAKQTLTRFMSFNPTLHPKREQQSANVFGKSFRFCGIRNTIMIVLIDITVAIKQSLNQRPPLFDRSIQILPRNK